MASLMISPQAVFLEQMIPLVSVFTVFEPAEILNLADQSRIDPIGGAGKLCSKHIYRIAKPDQYFPNNRLTSNVW